MSAIPLTEEREIDIYLCEAFCDASPVVSKKMGASFCIDLVSPHSHSAKIIYTVVRKCCRCAHITESGYRS